MNELFLTTNSGHGIIKFGNYCAKPTQIHSRQAGEIIQITEADVNAVFTTMKVRKAFGEDDIRPEVLKAMNVRQQRV